MSVNEILRDLGHKANSLRAIQRRLVKTGLPGIRPVKKSCLSQTNRETRLLFAHRQLN